MHSSESLVCTQTGTTEVSVTDYGTMTDPADTTEFTYTTTESSDTTVNTEYAAKVGTTVETTVGTTMQHTTYN